MQWLPHTLTFPRLGHQDFNMHVFMKREESERIPVPVQHFGQRTAQAIGVRLFTVTENTYNRKKVLVHHVAHQARQDLNHT
jgi:hypothetical protein